jgi:hypothetical protein
MDIKNIIIGRLHDHADELESFVDGLTPDELASRSNGEGHSISDLVLHLVDLQGIAIGWLARMLIEDRPMLEDSSGGCRQRHDIGPNLHAKLKEYREHRKHLIALLNALNDHQWKKEGIHPHIRHFTIEKCMEGLMRHEEHHLFQIYNLFFGAHIVQ